MFPISEKFKLLTNIVSHLVQKHYGNRLVMTEKMLNSADGCDLAIRLTDNDRIVVAVVPKPKHKRRN